MHPAVLTRMPDCQPLLSSVPRAGEAIQPACGDDLTPLVECLGLHRRQVDQLAEPMLVEHGRA